MYRKLLGRHTTNSPWQDIQVCMLAGGGSTLEDGHCLYTPAVF